MRKHIWGSINRHNGVFYNEYDIFLKIRCVFCKKSKLEVINEAVRVCLVEKTLLKSSKDSRSYLESLEYNPSGGQSFSLCQLHFPSQDLNPGTLPSSLFCWPCMFSILFPASAQFTKMTSSNIRHPMLPFDSYLLLLTDFERLRIKSQSFIYSQPLKVCSRLLSFKY